MIAEVIPYRRTIRGVDAFDYTIPEELQDQIQAGTTVWIPFRNKKIVGVVRRITDAQPTDKTKAIEALHDTQPWVGRIDLIEWFSRYYFVSLASALKTMQFQLLKRPKKIELETVSTSESLQVPVQAAELLSKASKSVFKANGTVLAHYTYRADCIALYSLLAVNTVGNVLIVVPEYGAAKELSQMYIKQKRLIQIPESASPSFMAKLLLELEQSDDLIVVGTKKAAFLPLHLFSFAICDQEESNSHKQFDSNPRYHTRSVLLHAQKESEAQLVLTSPSPSVQSYAITLEENASYLDMTRDRTDGQLTIINMEHEYEANNYSWFSEELQRRIMTDGKHLLLLNRTGSFRFAQCGECSELLALDANSCEHCKGTEIKKHRKGTTQIEKELRDLFPQKKVLRIDRTVEEISDEQIATADIVIGTERALRITHASTFDSIAVLSVDHLLVYPHFRSHERVYHLLSHVLSYSTPVLLQTHAPEHKVLKAIQTSNYDSFAFAELSTRQFLKLPPYVDRIRLIDTQTRAVRIPDSNEDLTKLPPTIHIDRE